MPRTTTVLLLLCFFAGCAGFGSDSAPAPTPVTPIGHGTSLPEMDHMQARGAFEPAPGGFLQPRTPWRLETTRLWSWPPTTAV